MSKILATLATTLIVLPLLGHPAFAAKNIGGFGAGGRVNAVSDCTTIMVAVWQCPPGDSPSNWPLTNCKLVMVPQTVCHAA